MDSVRKIRHQGKEVLVVDYSGCRGLAMIEIFELAKGMVLAEKDRYLILNVFNEKSYISGAFMKHVEAELPPVDIYIRKQAVIGLSHVQQWILKGLNLWYHRQIYYFKSQEEALDYLAS